MDRPADNAGPLPLIERTRDIRRRIETGEMSFAAAMSAIDELRRDTETSSDPMNQGRIENLAALLYYQRANYTAGIRHLERARKHYEMCDAARQLLSCDLNLGEMYRLQGHFSRARAAFIKSRDAAQEQDLIGLEAAAWLNEGQVLLSLNQLAEARAALERALNLITGEDWQTERDGPADRRDDMACEAHSALCTLALAENQTDDAWEHARQALELAQKLDALMRLGIAHRAIGDVVTQMRRSPDPAFSADPDHHYRQALDLFEKMGTQAEIGKTLFAQGKSLGARRKHRKAARLFERAMDIFTELGMTHDAARAADAQLEMLS